MAATATPAASPDNAGPLSPLLCFDLYAASRSITAVYRTLLDPLGLTYPQYLVLVLLWRHERSTVRELGEALRLDYNTVSPLLKRLEARGLISRRRRPDDERSVEIALTGEGCAMQEQTRHIPAAITQATGLDDQGVADLQRLLRHLTSSATAYAEASTH
ncbi:DNA-binding MarR family transcriptional regulator [Nonomuraea thailandensis]|uniref:DNA-binding MarR family transcriptional regulator n=1 Tax=Nonomuraea thailandensis TaxID=1188745 RepID=A0A9X2G964_9ACTN|nr:MarR family transcriptional regulator [Nonomuraea thailandensis]MCP2354752.1 DNA-binding MarR family transcriptional regulator [Nonomuraea thailandensis]